MVSLILLIVLTLVGFAAIHGTILQQKMAANLYDREVAFQSTEAAMRTAEALIPSTPAVVARNCQSGGVVCQSNPFNDPGLPAGSIRDVAPGTAIGQFTASVLGASQPQYVVENMGKFAVFSSSTGFSHSANSHNYGANGGAITAIYYRVTARSGDPAVVGDRAVVVLQAMIKQG